MDTKQCKGCEKIKPLTGFNKGGGCKDGFQGQCRECQKLYRAAWYNENKEVQRQRAREAGKTDRVRAQRKARYHGDEGYRLKRREQCRMSKQRASSKLKEAEWKRKQRREDPNFKIKENIRRRIRDVLMGGSKSAATMILMGCSMDELKAHLESQWLSGMSWNNYGVHGWHIDHIIPCAAFDLTKPEEQLRCFNWKNLQPLWAIDNWRKGDWVPDYQI